MNTDTFSTLFICEHLSVNMRGICGKPVADSNNQAKKRERETTDFGDKRIGIVATDYTDERRYVQQAFIYL
jgi:hypothetical protein